METVEIVAAFQDRSSARLLARSVNGLLLDSISAETTHLPFASLVLGTAAEFAQSPHADVGTYQVTERAIKNGPLLTLDPADLPGVVGVFPMVANPKIGPDAADHHWREHHAPLALEIHSLMTHYYQLTVTNRLGGPEWHGFALCCFASEDDLRQRFFNSAEGERRIADDVALFADARRSPRRVITRPETPARPD